MTFDLSKQFFGSLVQVSCFLALTLFLSATTAYSQQETPMLKGIATQFAEASKPLDPLLWPGNNFDKKTARYLLRDPQSEGSMWQQIPEWESGQWESTQAVNTRAIKYINGTPTEYPPLGVHQAVGRFIKGLMKDKNGGIWHLFNSDYWTETDLGDSKTYSYVMYSSPGGGEYPDFYSESVDFKVNKTTNKIQHVRRARTWTRYINIGPGMFKEESVRTNLDEQGQPTATTFNTALEKRTAPFSSYEKSFLAKKAMVDSFCTYLRNHGQEHLLPAPVQPTAK